MLLASCANTPIDHNVFHNLHARCSMSCVNWDAEKRGQKWVMREVLLDSISEGSYMQTKPLGTLVVPPRFFCVCSSVALPNDLRPGSHRVWRCSEVLANAARKKWSTLLPIGVFTQHCKQLQATSKDL